mmetsp:Transcript_23417/g.61080  ORF Transcript_23417/g.61080 Transcript_23417/m.61080 type:complete len:221 (-) Transcript_23417:33-695(-)
MGAVPPQYQLAGAPPPEAAQDFARLKYAVLAMGGTTAGRFIFSIPAGLLPGDFMNVLGIVFAFCIGSFLLKEDEHLKRVYDCLASSIGQQCVERGMYGLQCLLPFLMINVLNTIFDLFSLYKMSIMPYGFFLLASVVAEGGAAYFAYSAFKVCRDMQPSQGTEMEGGMGGGSGYVQAGDAGSARTIHSFGGSAQQEPDDATAQQAQSFQLFSGSGNRLGG